MEIRGPKKKDRTVSTPLRGIPDPPKGLDAASRKHWRDLCELIHEAGVLSTLDADALTLYVGLWARLREAEAMIPKTGGLVVLAHNKVDVPNPWYVIAKDTAKELARYLDAFGLTPKSRAKLGATNPDEVEDKWAIFS